MAGDPTAPKASRLAAYGGVVVIVAAATLLRMALTPIIGSTRVPFITYFPAVLFVAWYSGFRAALLSIVLSEFGAYYFFLAAAYSFSTDVAGWLLLVLFGVEAFGIALLAHAQRRAVERAEREAVQRRQAEKAEQALRQRLETTLASIADAVVATDAESRIVFINKVARSILRLQEQDLRGRPLDEVFQIRDELTRAKLENPVTRTLREGIVVGLSNHTTVVAADGTEIPIDDSCAPIRAEDGVIQGAVLVFRDITARRRAEEAGLLLASIVESSEDAIISKDINGLVTSWNKGAERIFGYSAQEMIGRPISTIAPEDHIDEMPRILERIRQGNRIEHFETVRRARNGTLVNISLTVSPVRDATGRIIGASKIARDITAQVRARVEIAEQRERLRITLSSIGDAVIATDTRGYVNYMNPVAEKLTGWSAGEAVGRPLEEVFRIIHEQSRTTCENPVAEVLREGQLVSLSNNIVLISRNGAEIFIDDSAAPIRAESGAILGAVLIFRDVSERRRMERELHESAEGLRMALDAGHMGAWEWRRDSGRVRWSPGLESIHGLSAGQFGGKFEDYLSDVHPDDHEFVTGTITRSLEEKADHDIEYRIVWPDGSIHWVHGKGRVVLDAIGNVVGMTGICMDTTARKATEDALRESEQRFRRLADSAPVMIWVSGLDKKRTWFNRPWLEFTGRTLEEEIGGGWAQGIHAEDLAGFRSVYPESFDRREPFTMEYRLRRHDGEWRWIFDTGSPLLGAEGSFLGYIGSCIDITERKRAEDRFHLAVEAAPNAMVMVDQDGKIVLANSQTEKLFGYSRTELLGQPVETLVPARFRVPHLDHRGGFLRAPLTRPMGVGRDLYGLRKDGSEFPVEIGLNPIQTMSGMCVLSAVVDITERKRLEQELRRLAEIVAFSDDAIISVQLDSTLTSWNRGAEAIYGYSAAEALGQHISILAPQAREPEFSALAELIQRGERIEQYQTKQRKKDGSVIDVSLTVSPVTSPSGELIGGAVVARDITRQVHARQALEESTRKLRASNEELSRLNEDLERFAFVASHDLQEPLRMIHAYSQLLEKEHSGGGDGNSAMFLGFIMEGAKRMRDLLADLLTYAEMRGRSQEPTETVDLNQVIESVKQNLKAAIDESGAIITQDSLPVVDAHRSHMVPLFQNLISNAMKYRSEQPPCIHVSAKEADGELEFAISDNGIGIPSEYHDQIFVPFKRLHGRKIPGTGIGLAICQRIVERYGGRIWVVSETGQGATFHFTLPGITVNSL